MSQIMRVPSYSTFDECPICFIEKYANHSSRLYCGHKLCSECLVNHAISSLQRKNNIVDCPLCRNTIITIPNRQSRTIEIENLPDINEVEQQPITINDSYKILYCLVSIVILFALPYLVIKLYSDITQLPKLP